MRVNMKFIAPTRLLAVVLVLALSAAAWASPAQEEQAPTQPRFRAGFFWEGYQLNDKNLTEFYGQFQKNLPGFEASAHIIYNIDAWMAYRHYGVETVTTYDGHVSKFGLGMFSLGGLYRFVSVGLIEPFIGAGLEFYSYSEKIEGAGDIEGASGGTVGFHLQLGTYVNITKFLAGKFYVRITEAGKTLATPLPDDTLRLDLGGKEFGFSLVARF